MSYLVDDFDMGFVVLSNIVVIGLVSMFTGFFAGQNWLTYRGAFLMGCYDLLTSLAEMV